MKFKDRLTILWWTMTDREARQFINLMAEEIAQERVKFWAQLLNARLNAKIQELEQKASTPRS